MNGLEGDGKVVFLSHTPDLGTFKVGSHHLSREFKRMGFDVGHIATPYSSVHRLRDMITGTKTARSERAGQIWADRDGVVHYIPNQVLPAQLPSLRAVRRHLEAINLVDPKFIFVDQPLLFPRGLSKLAQTVIYRPTDIVSGIAKVMQSSAVGEVAGVASTAQEVLSDLDLGENVPRIVIPNGVEVSRFASNARAVGSGLVYVGALDRRFDWDAVSALAEELPHEQVWLYGPTAGRTPNLPDNVFLKGQVSYSELPCVLSKFRVGLLPLNSNELNSGRSPMKFYEYLAAQLHVVARRTSQLQRRTAPGVWLYSSIAELIDASRSALSRNEPNTGGFPAAEQEDWSRKAHELREFARHCARNRWS